MKRPRVATLILLVAAIAACSVTDPGSVTNLGDANGLFTAVGLPQTVLRPTGDTQVLLASEVRLSGEVFQFSDSFRIVRPDGASTSLRFNSPLPGKLTRTDVATIGIDTVFFLSRDRLSIVRHTSDVGNPRHRYEVEYQRTTERPE